MFKVPRYVYSIMLGCMLMIGLPLTACELVIKAVSSDDWPPYFYKAYGKEAGLEVDILHTVLEKTPYCIEFVAMPSLSRAVEELKRNRVDLLVASSFNQDRANFSQFSQSYRDEKMVMFENKHNKTLSQPLATTANYKDYINQENIFIAVHRGSHYGKEFDQFLGDFKGNTISTTFAKQRFDLLKKGRVDFAIEDELAGVFLMADANYYEHIVNTQIVVFNEPVYYMLRKGLMNEQQLEVFNLAIKDSLQQIQDLIQEYSNYKPKL
ncbi:transporter substrate-binding domain-containing protein [uncultured Paraglaciecola sp.]|uniref:substrate-binding periplasmic protein n=1 Tax=uncultured Paraglaciecola sp. TaxID=1765024 RepID=UPI002597579D|nr:transporter substrate-binding domain-containing protein [uncultured Paraglaciecola sp.]